MNTVGVLSFLEAARTLKPSSERATKDLTRFLERVERLGILDLPAFAALDQRLELPARVRECLQRLASAGSAGLGLMDVSPEVLSHLQTATPDWAGVVRISLLNHGGSDGVFHLVDGQRPGVSSL
jgi:hypothetical protein